MLLKSTTLTFAISFSVGTEAVRSSPESAGTGACVTGSCFIAIVPPVATTATVGRSAARDGAPQSEPAKTKPKNALYPPDQLMVTSSFVRRPENTPIGVLQPRLFGLRQRRCALGRAAELGG